MWFSHSLPGATVPRRLCHRRVASCVCQESQTQSILTVRIPRRSLEGWWCWCSGEDLEGWDVTPLFKPDRFAEHHWEWEKQEQDGRRHLLDLHTLLQSFHFPWRTRAVKLKWTICFIVLWWGEPHGFSNEHKSKQNKITKFLGYLLKPFLISLLVSLCFLSLSKGFVLMITNFSDYFVCNDSLRPLISPQRSL